MERELFEKAITIDRELYAIKKSIFDIEEQGGSVFRVDTCHQNIVESTSLKIILKEANAKVLAILKEKAAKLEKEFAEL